MKQFLILLLILPNLLLCQYHPMSIHYTVPVGDTCTVHVIPANCYNDSMTIEGYIQGGERPIFYTWKQVNTSTLIQDSTLCTIVPGGDLLFDWLDFLGVNLSTPQPKLGNGIYTYRLTVIDSHVESATDKHDTLIVNFKYKFPNQITLPTPIASVPQCDTCIGEYLGINPQFGTEPYNILLIGTDNLGNNVEHYCSHCQSLNITNLAELYAGCYDIYVEDVMGCQEVFNYCYTTTGITELSLDKHLIKITDLMGKECTPESNKVLIYYFSDGSIIKTFKQEQ
jgi:hypothetical protein